MILKQPIKRPKRRLGMDRNETIGLMEPLLIAQDSPHRSELLDLAFQLLAASTGLRKSLPAGIVKALRGLVRSMNCYYSNFIEGHNTHPIDIERALKSDFSENKKQRDLQSEAKAHIEVQQWIDQGGASGKVYNIETIRQIHRRFYERLPEAFRRIEDPDTKERVEVIPGELRSRDVKVGRHFAVSPAAVPRFLERYEEVYGRLGKTETILAAAAAHHRLLWIHPFLDGNGRVARLVSHAVLLETLETEGLWSAARGLARNEAEYKKHLMACDGARRGDLDGRGSLSAEALAEFTRFFLSLCLDQVCFMEGLMQPKRLRDRILIWAEEEIRAGALPPKSGRVLEAVFFRGELPRGEVDTLLGTSVRSARRIVSELVQREVLVSESTRAPLRLAFPAALAERWMPGLFPAK